jgi:hypothetical protein
LNTGKHPTFRFQNSRNIYNLQTRGGAALRFLGESHYAEV